MTDRGPLREPTFLVLAALGPGPLHGYGIIKAVEQMSPSPRLYASAEETNAVAIRVALTK